MKKRKIPLRKSVVSGEMIPQKKCCASHRSKEGTVAIDPSGKMPGRGAYIAIEPEEAQLAWDKRILDRVLETNCQMNFIKTLRLCDASKSPKRVICK